MTEHSEDGTLCEAEGRSASDTEYTVNCGKCISGLSQLPGMLQTSFFHSSLSWLGQLWASLSCGVHRCIWASPNCDENSESKNSTEVAFSPAHLFWDPHTLLSSWFQGKRPLLTKDHIWEVQGHSFHRQCFPKLGKDREGQWAFSFRPNWNFLSDVHFPMKNSTLVWIWKTVWEIEQKWSF